MKTGYKIGEVMTQNPIKIGQTETLANAATLMHRHHVGALLVAEGDSLQGIITEQDIVRKAVAKGLDVNATPISEIMVGNLHTSEPGHDIHDALKLMNSLNIRHLPVLEEGALTGLLTMKDVLKIEPQLFEMVSHTIELREEDRKPYNAPNLEEGLCNLCGEYTGELMKHDELVICPGCYTSGKEMKDSMDENDE